MQFLPHINQGWQFVSSDMHPLMMMGQCTLQHTNQSQPCLFLNFQIWCSHINWSMKIYSTTKPALSKPDTRSHGSRGQTWGGYCWGGAHGNRRDQKQISGTVWHHVLVLCHQDLPQKSGFGMRSPRVGWLLLQRSWLVRQAANHLIAFS
jgi:hypothetical protein